MKICFKCQSTYPDDYSICKDDGVRLAAQFKGAEAQLATELASRFRVLHRLGRGGFGTVYLAEQIALKHRLVALKVLSGQVPDDPSYFKRFQNEAASAGSIHHINVVTIYDYGKTDDETPYIAMEFLEGEALSATLLRRGALPLLEVADILGQVARGLNAAHRLGIIHRDLKPDNIYMARGGEDEMIVKILDFGIAKLREPSAHSTASGLMGTPEYMSYDQVSGMNSDDLDGRSDIYSLGVVVYQMLTAYRPFYSDTHAGCLLKHIREQPPPFRDVAPALSVPVEVEAVVMKALAKNRDERYGTALEFAEEFRSATLPPTRPIDSGEIKLAEQARLALERAEAERRERERAEQERLAQERAEARRREREKAAAAEARRSASIKMIVASCVVALILIVAGVSYLSRSDKPPLPPPDATPPAATQPVASSPVSQRTTSRDPQPQISKPTQPSVAETGHLRISCDRPCHLVMDGSLQGDVLSGRAMDFTVASGRHLVEASVPNESGIAPQQRQISVYSSQTTPVEFSFSSELATRRQQIEEGLQRAKADEQNLEFQKAFDEYNRLAKLDKNDQGVKDLKQELQNLCSDHPDLDCPH